MAWVAVNTFIYNDSCLKLKERLFEDKPIQRDNGIWTVPYSNPGIATIGIGLPEGSIEKLIGRKLRDKDEPVKLK